MLKKSTFRNQKIKRSVNQKRNLFAIPQKQLQTASFFHSICNKAQSIRGITERSSTEINETANSFRRSCDFSSNNGWKKKLSFEDFISKKHSFQKVLKFNSLNMKQNQNKSAFIQRNSCVNERFNCSFEKGKDFQFNAIKKAIVIDQHPKINFLRTIEFKFNKTRLILEEEKKIQKHERIEKIYQKKIASNKFKKNQMPFDRESGDRINPEFSPWSKKRIDTYEAEFSESTQRKDEITESRLKQ